MREETARAYFALSRALAWLLRSAKYSRVRLVDREGEWQVRKRRRFYAPLLVWLSGPLMRIMDTGVRVLPQRDWEQRERQVYGRVYGTSIGVEAGGTVVLPRLAGQTLSTLLEDPALDGSVRVRAIDHAVRALAGLHAQGFTHGDAMAENVLVDLEAGVARWFDFETVHDTSRPIGWRRADDVRALVATCLIRTPLDKRARTLQLILDVYQDVAVTRLFAVNFTSVWRRPLAFHLAQAGLSFHCFREIGRLLRERPPAARSRGVSSRVSRTRWPTRPMPRAPGATRAP